MPSAPGQPKGDKRARTRAALVKAASELVGEKGFERTTLEDVARRAGMTRGAIYGNFESREALFVAVAEARWRPIAPQIAAGSSFAEQMRALAEAVIAALPERRKAAVGAASFQLYALTHEEMRERLVEANAESYRRTAQAMRANAGDDWPPIEAETLVKVLHSLTEGLVMLRALTPELIPDDIIRTAVALLSCHRA